MNRLRHLGRVVRIDDQRRTKLLCCAGKVTQHQHTLLVVACGDKFFADQVHAVVQACDQTQIGGTVQGIDGGAIMVRIEQRDWRRAIGLKPGVDAAHFAVHLGPERAVLSGSAVRLGDATWIKRSRPFQPGWQSSRCSTARSRSTSPLV